MPTDDDLPAVDFAFYGAPSEAFEATPAASKDYLADRLLGEYVDAVVTCILPDDPDDEPRVALRFSNGFQLIISDFMLFEPRDEAAPTFTP